MSMTGSRRSRETPSNLLGIKMLGILYRARETGGYQYQ